jgi:hypothetical protein
MKTQIFVQSEVLEDITVVELSENADARQLIDACFSLLPQDLKKNDFYLYVEDEDEDSDAQLKNLKKIPDGLRVHLHRQKGIEVVVRYAGRDVRRTFRPSATIARVKRWATHEFGLSPSDAAELMLQIAGTDTRPDADIHIGSLVKSPQQSITFDLVPSPRVNG